MAQTAADLRTVQADDERDRHATAQRDEIIRLLTRILELAEMNA